MIPGLHHKDGVYRYSVESCILPNAYRQQRPMTACTGIPCVESCIPPRKIWWTIVRFIRSSWWEEKPQIPDRREYVPECRCDVHPYAMGAIHTSERVQTDQFPLLLNGECRRSLVSAGVRTRRRLGRSAKKIGKAHAPPCSRRVAEHAPGRGYTRTQYSSMIALT